MIKALRAFVLAAVMLAACGREEPTGAEAQAAQEDQSTEGQVARISADAAREVRIETAVAGAGRIHELLAVYGVIQANAERQRSVTARFPGVVKSVRAVVGQFVKAGETLAMVEANDSLETYAITAPISGSVTARSVNPGETAGDKPLFVITDVSTVWVELSLFPRDLARTRVGQTVRIRTIDGDVSGAGRIVWISRLGESASQSITARVVLDNTRRQWTPGLYVSGEILQSEVEVPLAVRASGVQVLDDKAVVFVPVDGGFTARAVTTGRSDGDMTEVVAGLQPGEAYVSTNSFIVRAELEKHTAEEEH